MTVAWNGVFPALTTKFTQNDEVDLDLFNHNLQAQLDAGVHGVIGDGEAAQLLLHVRR